MPRKQNQKARGDATLPSMPQAWQEELCGWFLNENLTYKKARARLLKLHGVKTNENALRDYWATDFMLWRSTRGTAAADRILSIIADKGRKLDEATRALLRQLMFELAQQPNVPLDAIEKIAGILGGAAKLALDQAKVSQGDRRVALLEKKAAQADEAKKITSDETLTEEEKGTRMRQLFGLGK